jgi:parallel beta-helix repeat protein
MGRRTLVEDNHVVNTGSEAIACDSECTIVGNVIENAANEGIMMRAGDNNVIMGNYIKGCLGAPIGSWAGCTNTIISGNHMEDCSFGLYIETTTNNIIITDNFIKNMGYYGIYCGASNSIVSNNRVDTVINYSRGIWINVGGGCTVTGNVISNLTSGAIGGASDNNIVMGNNGVGCGGINITGIGNVYGLNRE